MKTRAIGWLLIGGGAFAGLVALLSRKGAPAAAAVAGSPAIGPAPAPTPTKGFDFTKFLKWPFTTGPIMEFPTGNLPSAPMAAYKSGQATMTPPDPTNSRSDDVGSDVEMGIDAMYTSRPATVLRLKPQTFYDIRGGYTEAGKNDYHHVSSPELARLDNRWGGTAWRAEGLIEVPAAEVLAHVRAGTGTVTYRKGADR